VVVGQGDDEGSCGQQRRHEGSEGCHAARPPVRLVLQLREALLDGAQPGHEFVANALDGPRDQVVDAIDFFAYLGDRGAHHIVEP
jgi:hypothetical protein